MSSHSARSSCQRRFSSICCLYVPHDLTATKLCIMLMCLQQAQEHADVKREALLGQWRIGCVRARIAEGYATRGNTVRLLRHTACFGCADPRLVPDVEAARPLPTCMMLVLRGCKLSGVVHCAPAGLWVL